MDNPVVNEALKAAILAKRAEFGRLEANGKRSRIENDRRIQQNS